MVIDEKTPGWAPPAPRPKTCLFELPLPRRSTSSTQHSCRAGYWRRCASYWKRETALARREAEKQAALVSREAEKARDLELQLAKTSRNEQAAAAAAAIAAAIRGYKARRDAKYRLRDFNYFYSQLPPYEWYLSRPQLNFMMAGMLKENPSRGLCHICGRHVFSYAGEVFALGRGFLVHPQCFHARDHEAARGRIWEERKAMLRHFVLRDDPGWEERTALQLRVVSRWRRHAAAAWRPFVVEGGGNVTRGM